MSTINISLTVVDAFGEPAAGVVICVECLAPPAGSSGVVIVAGPLTATSNDSGVISLTLNDGAKYSIRAGDGKPAIYIASSTGPTPALIAC